MTERGRIFAIEGGDGSGKGTQTKKLVDVLRAEGHDIFTVSFPRYGSGSARTIERYLRGEFGMPNDVAPELASAAFALDRVVAKAEIEQWRADNPQGHVFFDRYVLSNLAHQGTKIADRALRWAFYNEQLDLEFGDLALPLPDKNLILEVPVEVAQANVDKKAERTYTADKRDIHERDKDHLRLANRNYRELAVLYPEFTDRLEVYDPETGAMRPEDDIHSDIRRIFEV